MMVLSLFLEIVTFENDGDIMRGFSLSDPDDNWLFSETFQFNFSPSPKSIRDSTEIPNDWIC